MKIIRFISTMLLLLICAYINAQKKRPVDYHIKIGILEAGKNDAITDVPGVTVGHFTFIRGDSIITGATAIIPHSDNIFQNKVPAGIHIQNGFGKLTGYPQVEELGNIETPIILTNTLCVPAAMDALIDYTFQFQENKSVKSVNAIVGETNDGGLNDIRKSLKRLASRSMYGLARTGGISSNSSGDFAIAVSTAPDLRIPYSSGSMFNDMKVLKNESLDLLFEAVIEATEEAIINSLFAAETITGNDNVKVESLPVERTLEIMREYNRLNK